MQAGTTRLYGPAAVLWSFATLIRHNTSDNKSFFTSLMHKYLYNISDDYEETHIISQDSIPEAYV